MRKYLRQLAAAGMIACLAACGGGPSVQSTGSAEPIMGTTSDAVAHMGRGDGATARSILLGILQREPGNRAAQRLLDQIERDPEELLGSQSYSYQIRRGDTLSSIAQDRLGDASKFYALARYNNIPDPRMIAAGQTIRIPGTAPQAAPPKAKASSTRSEKPAPPRPASSQPAADPAQARKLRTQGLAAMNRGDISLAVSLLTRASNLDPGNSTIKADLARAKRIQKTVNR